MTAAPVAGSSLALAASAATGVLVGVALVLTRAVIEQTTPSEVAFLRYLIGVLFLLPLLARRPWVSLRRGDLLPILLLGIGQFAVLIVLLNYAVSKIEAGQAALIFATFPLITMALAVALGQEPFTLRRLLGIALTILGVGLSIGGAALAGQLSQGQWLGAGAAFLSAISGAICSVLYRPYLRRYPTLQIGSLAMLAAAVSLGLLLLPQGFFASWPSFTPGGWWAVIGIGLTSGVGYLLWLYALNRVWASNVAAFMGLSPLTAAALGALFLGEPLTLADGAGLVCLLAGLGLALWRAG
ncbi:MAG: DMT family transporter [Rhodospirillales bacterium]